MPLGYDRRVQKPVLVPLIVSCALFMENMDSTVIATSLPAIAADLGENPLSLKLALTSYLVALAVFIPISGWFADRYGSKRVFAGAIAVFMAGSLASAMSSSLGAFVAARFFQGMGGAMMVPVGRLVLLRAVPKSGLIQALNTLTITGLLGPVVGPPLGGFITQAAHWRWIFLINIPIAILGIFLVVRFIPDLREESNPPLDLFGFALTGIGLSTLMLGLSALGGHLLPAGAIAACVAVGALLLAVYAWHARRTDHPVMDLRLFRIPTFSTGVLGGNLFRLGVGATPFLLPLLFQLGFGLGPLASGLLTCAVAIGAMFMKAMTSWTLRRFGFRRVLVVNALLASAAIATPAFFTAATPHAVVFAVLLFGGCLRSLQFTALNAVTFADASREQMSQATGVSSMSQRLAQSLGVAIGAYALEISARLQGHAEVNAASFWPAFAFIGLLSATSSLYHARLPANAGEEVSGHRRG
jgi:EmrB/QacA subfamily drug resistance transporter